MRGRHRKGGVTKVGITDKGTPKDDQTTSGTTNKDENNTFETSKNISVVTSFSSLQFSAILSFFGNEFDYSQPIRDLK